MAITPVKLTLLHYKFAEGSLEKRIPLREEHLNQRRKMVEEGRLIMCGAVGENATGGLHIFKNVSNEEIEEFVKADPYYQNDIIQKWYIEPYTYVLGTIKDALQ